MNTYIEFSSLQLNMTDGHVLGGQCIQAFQVTGIVMTEWVIKDAS